jgi:hypothetical protein
MSLQDYKKTIEQYINKKDKSNVSKDAAKGLLAPKSQTSSAEMKQTEDTISSIAEFVYGLRQKRRELVKARITKKDSKKNGK